MSAQVFNFSNIKTYNSVRISNSINDLKYRDTVHNEQQISYNHDALPTTINELKHVIHRVSISRERKNGIVPYRLNQLRIICKNLGITCYSRSSAVEQLYQLVGKA